MSELEIKPGHAYAIRVHEGKEEDGTVRMSTEFIGEITLCNKCQFSREPLPGEDLEGVLVCCLGFMTKDGNANAEICVDPNFYCKYGKPKEVKE